MPDRSPLRDRLARVIFGHDTRAGRLFDGALIAAILLSVAVVILDSVASISTRYRGALTVAEWAFTVLFTVEYILRLWTAQDANRYMRSFYGLVDLVAVLPAYLSVLFPAGRFLLAIRVLRVVRVFRVLKLSEYVGQAGVLGDALRAARYKISVFLVAVTTVVVVVGSLMYLIEGPEAGFTSIPAGIYWAVVTITTVGYGDIAPQTPLGQALAVVLMITGYAIIAVPTGIVTVELSRAGQPAAPRTARVCPACTLVGHDADAAYCKRCGAELAPPGQTP
ncbi:MAG TPA: ion transporter [Rhodothermales bacterium]|nr:ion transporter [Rhodothermales bacterium]